MKPIHQTTFGKDNGNCLAAAIASILEIDLETVPNFCAISPDTWFKDASDFVRGHGYALMLIEDKNMPNLCMSMEGVYSIVSGKSPRGDHLHCIVAKGNEGAHDPHPENLWIENPPVDHIFFIAMDPRGVKPFEPPTILDAGPMLEVAK